ncbi:MAG: DUF370 domain-containing protein [Clostridiales bacterium]|nr:MAG: DUF370 domain-containing protein [Clostridiales bacterium]
MSNNANMISIGFDNYVNFDRVIAVLAADDPQAKKALCRRKRRTKNFWTYRRDAKSGRS